MRFITRSSGKLPVVIIIVAMLVVCLGVGAITFKKMGRPKVKHATQKQKVELTAWKLEEFVVNLADRAEVHYLKVTLVLEIQGKSSGGEGDTKSSEEARARDTIISVLTRRRYADLLPEEGKIELKSELKAELNSTLEDTKVENIYFTSFAMQ